METKRINAKLYESGAEFCGENFNLKIEAVRDNIFHCSYSKEDIKPAENMILDAQTLNRKAPVRAEEKKEEGLFALNAGKILAEIDSETGIVTWKKAETGEVLLAEGRKEFLKVPVIMYTTGGETPVVKRVKTVDGERNFIQNLREESDHDAYQGRLHFVFKDKEKIHGLGQFEEGFYDYRMHTQYLYQHNMRIPMPMIISSEGYGILFDATCLMTFRDDECDSYMYFDAIPQLDYFVIRGDSMDEIIDGFRQLTGRAAMLPKWAYGYVQSKEQYYTAEELRDIVKHYREIGVPLDCVVQDWNTWEKDQWGQKSLDPERYGNMEECAAEIRAMGAHTMISIWPNMNTGTANHTELLEQGMMLNDLATYDAFNPKAREVFWRQAKTGLFDRGFESFWCDSTEPFSGPDWGGEIKREPWVRFNMVGTEHKKYLPAEKANAYALVHAKGIYENQRKETEDIRVLNLTRSGFASGQKYAALLWSGDITAEWSVMKKQIAEGLNMAMAGYPYWTLDTGGFFTVGREWQKRGCSCNNDPTPKWFWQGRFDDGVKDKGFCELYTRWIEFSCFLPMFRSHGTDTPREIWNFGEKGSPCYDAIEKYIKLRYKLMPYIYSLAGDVVRRSGTIMRSLLFDFPEDEKAARLSTEYMFGKSILVCPVFEPMYYEANSTALDRKKIWPVYLPAGHQWYSLETGEVLEGGQHLMEETPLDIMPLYIKAGSIIPMKQGLQYAMEKTAAPLEIHVYPGEDGSFILYEDAGNDYTYEKGEFAEIELIWKEREKTLTIGKREGCYKGMADSFAVEVYLADQKAGEFSYEGKEVKLELR